MRKNVIAMLGLLVAVLFGLTGCGGGGGSSTPQTTAISGTVTFPTSNGTAKVVAAATTAANLEIRDLTGALVTTVPLTLQSGTANTYTYPAVNLPIGKDYVLKAVNGSMVMRALVDKAALAGSATTKNVDNISSTALIVVEKSLSIPAGTLGGSATATQAQAAAAAVVTLPPATIESNITTAIAACTSASATPTAPQAQLASLANIVTAAVASNVDPSAFIAGTATTTTVNAVTYTVSGPVASGPISTSTAGTFATDIAASLPKISSASSTSFTVGTAGNFTVTGTGTLSVSGTLPSGVTFDAATGILSGIPATGSNSTYTLTFTAASNNLTATQAFTLTVNPAAATPAGFTTAMLSGKVFIDSHGNTFAFNTDGTFTASDSPDAKTWSITSSGQIAVKSPSATTTVTLLSGSLTTGFNVNIAEPGSSINDTLTQKNVTSIIGTWGGYGDPLVQTVIFTFVDSTHFMMVQSGPSDTGGQTGLEYGTYTWNAATGTGTFTKTPIFDTNGDWGTSHPPTGTSYSISVNGDTLTIGNAVEGNHQLPRLKSSTTNPVIGGWWNPGATVLLAFLDDTHFLQAQVGTTDTGGQSGIELGTYAINSTTHVLSTSPVVDTNGDWGTSNPPVGTTYSISVSGNTLTVSNTVEGSMVATRLQ